MSFQDFKLATQRQFNEMKKHDLFRVLLDKDKLWDLYLDSFPAGTNEIYKERREYDCNCCKQFVRAVGNMVAIIDNKIVTIWDCSPGGYYQVVTDAVAAYVKSCAIDNVFLHTEKTAGTDKNYQDDPFAPGDKKKVITWEHFYIQLPDVLVAKGVDIGPRLSEYRSSKDVMLRGLVELTHDSIDTVLELIAQNSLYRGEEHKFAITEFLKVKKQFDKLTDSESQNLFVWSQIKKVPASVSRFRNTVIGTLITDLSEGVEMEKAVASFESKVAPTNYKRPTALVTKAMIENAKNKIEELGLLSALNRRYAYIEDITINNVLYADRSVRKVIDNVFDEMVAKTPDKVKNLDKVEEVNIDKFITDILPKVQSIELLLENRHTNNLVSLIAPCDLTAKGMFKWNNNFSWSYTGQVADSMRERVVAAGGRVDGCLRFTHSWNHPEMGRNCSLMDLHVFMPGCSVKADGSNDIYPSGSRVGWNRRKDPSSGGVQDVDYTNAAPENYIPIENITFPDIRKMPEGKYILKIHNWNLRAPTTSGFKAEIEFDGNIFQYEYRKPMANKEWVTVAEITLKKGVFTIEHKLDSSASVKEIWNLSTQSFHKVNAIMRSPNYWNGEGSGNQHMFFMLDGCKNDGTARGFYNEFLSAELDPHRKVLEIVGAKMQTDASDNQLSGVGFSSTQRNDVLVRVKGTFNRTIKLIF